MPSNSATAERCTSRRAVLASAGGVLAGVSSGCVQRVRSLVGRRTPEQLSLTIKTVPADDDEAATTIARRLATNLDAVGIDANIQLMAEDELLREVLVNHAFDVYVARHPGERDPDFLRSLLHSSFASEPGWQNPFGFSDLSVDDLLARQRRLGGPARRTVVGELQRRVVRQQPFSVVAFPDRIGAVRSDRFTGWSEFGPESPLRYVALERAGRMANRPDPTDGPDRLTVTTTDDRATRNRNPIAVEFRSNGPVTGLLYDPLGRRYDGSVRPWLAESWTWRRSDEGETTATVRLRADLTWHDGRPLTVDDVAFTYRFLVDTSLGRAETAVPAPRFRGSISMVDRVETVDDRGLRFSFGRTSTEVAARALTVPILPRHEWEPKASEAEVVGLDLFDGVTEALVWPNPEPVGSGPLRFESATPERRLVLSRYDDHFLERDDGGEAYGRFGGLPYERLVVRIAPSDEVAVALVGEGDADATISSLSPDTVPRIGRLDQVTLQVQPHRAFYHVGFNVRRDPLGNPRFRRAVAQLIDKARIAETVLDGYATPATSPLAETEWTPPELAWEGSDPELPFAGTAGVLDAQSARDAFREAGYRYSDEGELLQQ